jgi:ABC-type nitrate/sulfonate/bicarbonate transport system substrate-binding protein
MRSRLFHPILIIALLSATIHSLGCQKDRAPEAVKPTASSSPTPLPKLTVGIQVSPAMTLLMVAEKKGFFNDAGVDVELKEFTAGKFALQAFLGGSLDMAISGEVPVALSTLQGNKFRVIGQVVEKTINEVRVVGHKERGVDTAEKYFKGKKRKLATSFGGGPEFFTYNFLKKHGIKENEVEIISQKPEDMTSALVSGSVDAIAIFDPFARFAERSMGDGGITFADADIYSELYVASVMQKTLEARREALIAFMRGLKAAEDFVAKNPDESKKILIGYTKLDRQVVDDIWPNFVFKPAITPLFVDLTTAEAKWAIEKKAVPAGTVAPDYRAILDLQILEAVDPSAVKLP